MSILHEMQSVHRRATRAPHPGVRPHSDQSDWAMPWEKGCSIMMVFLDDIDEKSGALEYKPTSHLQHFLREDGSQPAAGHPPRHDGPEVSTLLASICPFRSLRAAWCFGCPPFGTPCSRPTACGGTLPRDTACVPSDQSQRTCWAESTR